MKTIYEEAVYTEEKLY